MAGIERRGTGENTKYRVHWRHPDKVLGKQSTTWADERLALRAKALAEGFNHHTTSADIYEALLGVQPERNVAAVEAADGELTLSQWADRWLKVKTNITPGTKDDYRRLFNHHIKTKLGHIPLSRLTGAHVGEFVNWLRHEQKLANTTVTKYFAVLNVALVWAMKDGLIPSNPAARVHFNRKETAHDETNKQRRNRRVYLTPEELDMILRHAARPTSEVIIGLAYTGCRWSELTALTVDCIDLNAKTLYVGQAWKKHGDGKGFYLGTTKGRNAHTIRIADELYPVLERRVTGRPADALVFTTPDTDKRWDYSNFHHRFWSPAVVAAMRCPEHPPVLAGLTKAEQSAAVSECACPTRLQRKPTIHKLRHSLANWLLTKGVDPILVQYWLGHASLATTTEIYGDLMHAPQDRAVDVLNTVRVTAPALAS